MSAPLSRTDDPVLVTGGAGFIGCNPADRLAGSGRTVTVLDALSRAGVRRNLDWLAARHGARIRPVIGDLRDPEAVARAAADAGAAVHLAARVAVTTSPTEPMADFTVNALGTLALLEALRRRADPPPLVFASTNKL
jgi:CDP-paratose 2-epimerase